MFAENDGVPKKRVAAMLRRQEAHQVRCVAAGRDRSPGVRDVGGTDDDGDVGGGGGGDKDAVITAGYTGA